MLQCMFKKQLSCSNIITLYTNRVIIQRDIYLFLSLSTREKQYMNVSVNIARSQLIRSRSFQQYSSPNSSLALQYPLASSSSYS